MAAVREDKNPFWVGSVEDEEVEEAYSLIRAFHAVAEAIRLRARHKAAAKKLVRGTWPGDAEASNHGRPAVTVRSLIPGWYSSTRSSGPSSTYLVQFLKVHLICLSGHCPWHTRSWLVTGQQLPARHGPGASRPSNAGGSRLRSGRMIRGFEGRERSRYE